MKLEYVVRDLILTNKIRTQSELTNMLLKQGYETTQSNISRILKKLNTVKIVDDNKDTYYIIQPKPLEISSWVKNLITIIDSNEKEIMIKTYVGAGGIINQILNERNIDNVFNTIYSDNSVLISVYDTNKIEETKERLKTLFLLN